MQHVDVLDSIRDMMYGSRHLHEGMSATGLLLGRGLQRLAVSQSYFRCGNGVRTARSQQ